MPPEGKPPIFWAHFAHVPTQPIMAWENEDIGFYCERLQDEREAESERPQREPADQQSSARCSQSRHS